MITGIEVLDAAGRALRGTTGDNVLDLSGFTTVTGLAGLFGLGGNDTPDRQRLRRHAQRRHRQRLAAGGGGDDTFVIRGSEAQGDTMAGGAGLDRILVDTSGIDAVISTTARLSTSRRSTAPGSACAAPPAPTCSTSPACAVSNVTAISGLEGNDTLAGGTGDDVLTGGAGNDSFVFRFGAATGDDRITDFDASGNDVIRLAGYGATMPASRRRRASMRRAPSSTSTSSAATARSASPA